MFKRILVVLLLIIIVILFYFFWIPSKRDRLIKDGPWCVNSIYYKGRLIQPRTLHAIYMIQNNGKVPCVENINFDNDGNIQLPGINSRAVAGEWTLDSTKKMQLNADTLKDIYEGTYDIDFSGSKLVLKSKTTIINANR